MKISIDWLGDFLDWTVKDPIKVAEKLTSCTAEVEEVEVQGAYLDKCCVGKVLSIKKHPNADKLSLCDVETDDGKKKVVCGGTNMREGMRVAFAHVGARVKWHGEEMMTLEKAKIRGEESFGMICAADELGLATQFPEATGGPVVIDLGDGDEDVGKSLKEYLSLGGTVFHIDNHAITHRPDLFSHLGFARECVALGLATWKKDRPTYADHKFPKDPLPFKNVVECKEQIPRYLCTLLTIESLGETPDWMARRLTAVGLRPLNLPVDITNYVMLEVGMPLHSFDADDFKGDVHMRLSKKGEKIVTLDEAKRELTGGDVVLSDDEGIFDLLGVMGGLRSSTKEETKNVYLHSAGVDPVSIRRTILSTGHRTDAATIYEKGVPNVIVRMGFNRALELFLELVPGAKVMSRMDSWGNDGKASPIKLSAERVSQFLGTEITGKTVEKILKDLEFSVTKNGDAYSVTTPLHRLGDISDAHDLIEEVGRVFGYDNIESVLPRAAIDPPERDQRVHMLRDALKAEGFMEILPLSLVGPSLLEKAGMSMEGTTEIENPLGEEVSLMQSSTLPGLFDHAEHNLLHVEKTLKTFHWGHVFHEGKEEKLEMGLLVTSRIETGIEDDPFLILKDAIRHTLKSSDYELNVVAMKDSPTFAHPGRSAHVFAGEEMIGELFEIHPVIRSNFDLPHRASAARLDLSALLSLEAAITVAKPVPQFPEITYDITIPFSQEKSVAEFVAKVEKTSDLLESVEVAKLFAKGSDMQNYNLTLRCIYRAKDRTLKEKEAKEAHKAVLALVG